MGYLSAILATCSTTSLGPMKLVRAVSLQVSINLNLKQTVYFALFYNIKRLSNSHLLPFNSLVWTQGVFQRKSPAPCKSIKN